MVILIGLMSIKQLTKTKQMKTIKTITAALKVVEELQVIAEQTNTDIEITFSHIDSLEDIKKLAKQENSHVLGNDDFTPWYFAVIRFGKVRATFRHSETFNKN